MDKNRSSQEIIRSRPESEMGGYNFLDRETLVRFAEAFRKRKNLISLDLPREMGYDYILVDAQKVIDIAEEKGVIDKLYELLGTDSPEELIKKLIALPKTGLVRNTLGGIAYNVGITFDDLMDTKKTVGTFLKLMDNPEAVEKLKGALTRLGC